MAGGQGARPGPALERAPGLAPVASSRANGRRARSPTKASWSTSSRGQSGAGRAGASCRRIRATWRTSAASARPGAA
eukprot:620748-Pyramimonas_sp.AAC.1